MLEEFLSPIYADYFNFRELDLNVFEILKCGLVSKAVLDSDMNTEVHKFTVD